MSDLSDLSDIASGIAASPATLESHITIFNDDNPRAIVITKLKDGSILKANLNKEGEVEGWMIKRRRKEI